MRDQEVYIRGVILLLLSSCRDAFEPHLSFGQSNI